MRVHWLLFTSDSMMVRLSSSLTASVVAALSAGASLWGLRYR